MLVDSHCHLDFPDFADELDAIVARAHEAGIGRLVTISTRVRRLDGLLAITERFSNVYCSVGTHPHRPPNVAFDGETILDSDDMLDLKRIPRHLVVVGATVIGIEYATIFSALDVQVTVLEPGPGLLSFVDRELADEFVHDLRDRGEPNRVNSERRQERECGADRFGEALIRCSLRRARRAAQNAGAVAFDLGELVHQPGLADSRLAADEHEAAGALRGSVPVGA